MKPSRLKQTIHSLLDTDVAIFLWGSPGIGKSSIVKQIASEKQIGFIDLRLALLDPTDLKGIPFFDKENHQAVWASPSFLPSSGEGILFLDELNSAPPSVQASAYQLILDRAIGEYTLPDGWKIIAAGNNEEDHGITYKMPAPLANRFIHLHLEIDTQEWLSWAYKNNIDFRVTAYIRYKNEALFAFNDEAKSFPTPRSWEFVSKIFATKIEGIALLESISGAIGEEVAIDLLQFAKVAHTLPDISQIFAGTCTTYPQDDAALYTLSSLLVSAYLQNPTKQRLNTLLQYLLNLKAEFSVMCVQELQRNGVDMLDVPLFAQWVEKFSYLLE
jgi:hypothetical protein